MVSNKKVLKVNLQINVSLGADTDECISGDAGVKVVCVLFSKCQIARELLKENKLPKHCGFDGLEAKVCCPGYTEERIQKPGDLARDGL